MTSSKTWVIASPNSKAYFWLTPEEILNNYQKMAFDEFDKQFTSIGDPKETKGAFNFPYLSLSKTQAYFNLEKQTIDISLSRWHEKPVDNASLHSVIYTTDGIPWGEAVYIKNATPDVCITDDLKQFYENHCWNAVSFEAILELEKIPVEQLDNILIEELFSLCNQKFLSHTLVKTSI